MRRRAHQIDDLRHAQALAAPQVMPCKCPHCKTPVLHDDMRVTNTHGAAAEVTGHCRQCMRDVVYGYVVRWFSVADAKVLYRNCLRSSAPPRLREKQSGVPS